MRKETAQLLGIVSIENNIFPEESFSIYVQNLRLKVTEYF